RRRARRRELARAQPVAALLRGVIGSASVAVPQRNSSCDRPPVACQLCSPEPFGSLYAKREYRRRPRAPGGDRAQRLPSESSQQPRPKDDNCKGVIKVNTSSSVVRAWRARIAGALLCLACSAALADTGGLKITVTDANGEPVAGATVSASTPDSLTSRSGVTGTDGIVRLEGLDPSNRYEVAVSGEG